MEQNKTGKYFKYAIGEIVLVMIGILLALQVNNFNIKIKNQKHEKQYLTNLLQDLQVDSLRLAVLEKTYKRAYKSKKATSEFNLGNSTVDSLVFHFMYQYYFVTNDFVAITTTIDEIKSTGNLNLITNNLLKRKIISQYNHYDELKVKLQIGHEKSMALQDYAFRHINNIMEPTEAEIKNLNQTPYFRNIQVANFIGTLLTITEKTFINCKETIEIIKEELRLR